MSTLTLASEAVHEKIAPLKSVDRSWRHLVAKVGAGEEETMVLRKGENKKGD